MPSVTQAKISTYSLSVFPMICIITGWENTCQLGGQKPMDDRSLAASNSKQLHLRVGLHIYWILTCSWQYLISAWLLPAQELEKRVQIQKQQLSHRLDLPGRLQVIALQYPINTRPASSRIPHATPEFSGTAQSRNDGMPYR
jgi:hypothetical protein